MIMNLSNSSGSQYAGDEITCTRKPRDGDEANADRAVVIFETTKPKVAFYALRPRENLIHLNNIHVSRFTPKAANFTTCR